MLAIIGISIQKIVASIEPFYSRLLAGFADDDLENFRAERVEEVFRNHLNRKTIGPAQNGGTDLSSVSS